MTNDMRRITTEITTCNHNPLFVGVTGFIRRDYNKITGLLLPIYNYFGEIRVNNFIASLFNHFYIGMIIIGLIT